MSQDRKRVLAGHARRMQKNGEGIREQSIQAIADSKSITRN